MFLGEEEKERTRRIKIRKEREVELDSQKDDSGAAVQESGEFRSWVEPEHYRDDHIPAFKYTLVPRRMGKQRSKTNKHIKIIPSNQFDLPSCTT